MKNNCSVIIPAAGSGARMNSKIKKQFILLDNKPILIHTLEKFDNCKLVSELIVVVNKIDIDYCEEIINQYKWNKSINIVEGGETRQESVKNGLDAINILDSNQDIVVVHDGARPFITIDCIEKSIRAAKDCGAVVTGVKVKDTIKETNSNDEIISTPDRSSLWMVQTPQTFKYNIISKAHYKALKNKYTGTDDAVLVEKFTDCKVKMITGDYSNIKITTKEDLIFANSFIKSKKIV